jgi:hypothetical protein
MKNKQNVHFVIPSSRFASGLFVCQMSPTGSLSLLPLKNKVSFITVYLFRIKQNNRYSSTVASWFHSRFKLAHSCQKEPNLHRNSLSKLLLCNKCIKSYFFSSEKRTLYARVPYKIFSTTARN